MNCTAPTTRLSITVVRTCTCITQLTWAYMYVAYAPTWSSAVAHWQVICFLRIHCHGSLVVAGNSTRKCSAVRKKSSAFRKSAVCSSSISFHIIDYQSFSGLPSRWSPHQDFPYLLSSSAISFFFLGSLHHTAALSFFDISPTTSWASPPVSSVNWIFRFVSTPSKQTISSLLRLEQHEFKYENFRSRRKVQWTAEIETRKSTQHQTA